LFTWQTVVRGMDELPTALDSLPDADLLVAFGAVSYFDTPALPTEMTRRFPGATIVGCSTAGEIAVDRVYDGTCAISAVKL
jgi:hypothetical protein